MEYVAMLRGRRVLTWYGTIFLALTALGLALAFKDGPPRMQMSRGSNPMIPFEFILAGAAFAPVLLASFLAVGLDAEYKTAAITFTRPLSRALIALRYLAVDGGSMIAAWLITLAVVLITIFVLGIGKYLTFGHEATDAFSIVLGCAVMWYGLIVLVTALLPGRGNAVAGGSWAYALLVPGLAQIPFPPLLHQVMVALNYLSPLSYLGNIGSSNGHSQSLIAGTPLEHTIAVWLIGLVAIAVGTRIWATREVPG